MNRGKRVFGILAGLSILSLIAVAQSTPSQQSAEDLYEAALLKKEAEGDLEGAIKIFQTIVTKFPGERAVAAKAQLHIGLCYEKLGLTEAEKAYQKVISDFPDRVEEVKAARQKLSLIAKTRSIVNTEERGPNIRQIWSGPGASDVGQPSLDGKYLSFIDRKTGNLAVKDLASGKTRLLTNKGPLEKEFQFAGNSCWSRDGKRLAYSWFSRTNVMELRIIDADGSNVRTLYQKENEFAFPMAWSPDGKSLAVSLLQDYYRSYCVSVISIDDGSLRILKKANLLRTAPRNMIFSRDGRFIVVDLPQGEGDPKHDIFALSVDGDQETRVVEHPADDWVLDWVPGSDRLLFSSDRMGTHDAWLIDIIEARAQGDPRLVRKNLGPVVPLGFSRAGDLFYRLHTAMEDISIASINLEKGTLIDPPKALSQALVGVNYDPQWSPDGKYLAFVSDLKEGPGGMTTQALRIRSSETGETHAVVTKIRRFGRPRWAPDSRSVFVVGTDGTTSLALYRIDMQTGEATFYLDSEPGANIKFIAPSADGKSVYYTYFEFSKKRSSIMCIDLATKETRKLYQDAAPPDIGDLAISPDGKSLAFRVAEPGWSFVVKVLELPGGAPRDLVRSKIKVAGTYIWAPDGKSVLFFKDVSEGKEQKSELWAAAIEGGEPHSLGLTIDATTTVLSLHPDTRRIAFAIRQPSSEVWVMEDFLPDQPAVQAEAEKGAQEFKVQKVWDAPIYSLYGPPSPDGRYLTYTSQQDFLNLGVYDLAKGENRLLTHHKSWADGEYCYYPIFSPDASRIAYCCQVKGRLIELRTVNLDGTSTRILRNGKDGVDYIPFGWTSDGKDILTAFFGSDNLCGIAFVSALDGSIKGKKALSLKVPWGEKMHLSPDGKYISGTFLPRWDSGNKDIFLLAIDGGKEMPIVEHPAADTLIGWSPDGGQVLFTSDRTGQIGIWAVRISDGKAVGKPEFVRGNLGIIQPIGMTREGKLYYGIHTGGSDVFVAPIDPVTGEVMAQPTKAVRKYETFNSIPDWSPDGQFLVCHSSRGRPSNESPVLLITSMQTKEIRELTPKTPGGGRFGAYYLRWSPGGRSFIGGGRDEKGQVGALLSVDVQTGEAKVLARADSGVDGQGNILAPNCSPDAKSIYFIRIGNQFRRLCTLDLETGVEKEIGRFSKDSGPFYLALSPDGRQLAFNAEGKIRILSRDGAESRDLPDGHAVAVLDWMPDGKTILYGKPQDGNPDVVEVWRVPAAGGEPQKAGLSMPRLSLLKVSPDGKNVALMATEQPSKSEVWVMENFLPKEK